MVLSFSSIGVLHAYLDSVDALILSLAYCFYSALQRLVLLVRLQVEISFRFF